MLAGHGRHDGNDFPHLMQILQKIGEVAHETVQMADGIVWAVNPRNDTLHHLANYLVRFTEDFFRHTPIRCRLDVPLRVPPMPLSSQLRHHLLLAVKEASNNAARHSGATEVWLRLEHTPAMLAVCIEDNGCGFDPATARTRGNGLKNLHARMTGVGGTAEVTSAAGWGTCVKFVVPLPKE